MNKILQGIFIILFSIPILLISSTILYYTLPPTYDSKTITLVEDRVTSYLMDDKGYQREDIIFYETQKIPKGYRGNDKHLQAYQVSIIFKDEPEASYYYSLDKKEKVKQRGYGGNAQRHVEKEVY